MWSQVISFCFFLFFFFFYFKKQRKNLHNDSNVFVTKEDEEVKYTNFCTLIDFHGNLNEIV